MKRLGQSLGDTVRSFERARHKRRQRNAEHLEQMLREVIPPDIAAQLALNYAAQTPDPDSDHWTFAMISPAQNSAVVSWLSGHSKRPRVAVQLWAMLFMALRTDTGEIQLTREEMGSRLGVDPDHISRVMTELASINAIRREKSGRAVRYFMNPHIATHIPSPEAREAARQGAGPLLVVMDGGKTDT